MIGDMNEWMPIITASIAIIGTLLGTLLTGLLSARSERQRRAEEDKREIARVGREHKIAIESEKAEIRETDAAIATEIAALFFEVRRIVKQLEQDRETDFPCAFDDMWESKFDEQLRMKVGHVKDNDARNRLNAVMEALLDFEPLAAFSGSVNTERFVDDAVLLGAELALALSRGQQPEGSQAQRSTKLGETLNRWDAFLDHQQQERAELERRRLEREKEERREFKREELATDAMLDLAVEFPDESEEN